MPRQAAVFGGRCRVQLYQPRAAIASVGRHRRRRRAERRGRVGRLGGARRHVRADDLQHDRWHHHAAAAGTTERHAVAELIAIE